MEFLLFFVFKLDFKLKKQANMILLLDGSVKNANKTKAIKDSRYQTICPAPELCLEKRELHLLQAMI